MQLGGRDLIFKLVKLHGFCVLVGQEGGEAKASRWMTELTGDSVAVMRSGGFWALVGKEGGEAKVSRWCGTGWRSSRGTRVR